MIKKVLLISALVLGTFSLSLARENKVASIIPYPNDVQMGEGFFNAAGAAVVDGTTYFLLANDIDMAPIKNWIPINYDGTFSRQIHFDGGNFTLNNFAPETWEYTKESEESGESTVVKAGYHSLFGVLYGSVKNLKIDNVTIEGANACGVIGGYVGTAGKPGLVENVTITNASVTNSADRAGGVCGNAKEATFKKVVIERCYSTSDITSNTAGTGGIVGTLSGESSEVTDCIAWNANIICNRASNDKWAPGAVVGAANVAVTLTDCFRNANMNFVDKAGAMTLSDQENVSNATPPVPSYLNDVTQAAYHGKAAATGATISSVATFLGWSADIWDLSKDVPTLK